MTPPIQRPPTNAFMVQAAISFAIALLGTAYGIAKLPLDAASRGFLALGLVFVTSSAFTLAKTIRDRQETAQVTTRVDQARLDKLLTEHDPFDVKNL
ncbi:YiaA/YiaB family inner membrane protein [Streptomyces sp. NPDC051940]|uniref:YiaA/YiaB family inner membrane protein n=1 Tax=Streptomyces sp. NPDC051940 TaxID=3155675 RepID=UPI00341F0A19